MALISSSSTTAANPSAANLRQRTLHVKWSEGGLALPANGQRGFRRLGQKLEKAIALLRAGACGRPEVRLFSPAFQEVTGPGLDRRRQVNGEIRQPGPNLLADKQGCRRQHQRGLVTAGVAAPANELLAKLGPGRLLSMIGHRDSHAGSCTGIPGRLMHHFEVVWLEVMIGHPDLLETVRG